MALRTRIHALFSIFAGAGLLFAAVIALAQPVTQFIGLAMIAALTGGIALTWGISLFQKGGYPPVRAVFHPAASEI